MLDRVRWLTPAADGLVSRYLRREVRLADGVEATYDGAAWCAEHGPHLTAAFCFTTTAVLQPSITLNVFVQGEAVVMIRSEDRTLVTRPVDTTASTLQTFTLDLTDAAMATADCQLTMLVEFPNGGGEAFVPDAESPYACVLEQHWITKHSMPVAAFFAAAAFLLVTAAIAVAGAWTSAQVQWRAYGLVPAAMVFLYESLQLPAPRSISIRAWLRRIYAGARRFLWPVTAAVALAGIVLSVHDRNVVRVMRMRYRYTTLIQEALSGHDGAIQDAFRLCPWRREAQMLIERNTAALRPGDDAARQRYLRTVTESPGFREAALTPLDGRSLEDDAATTADPLLLYTALRMEAAAPKAIADTDRLLAGRQEPDALVQWLIAHMIVVYDSEVDFAATADRLKTLLDTDPSPALAKSFLYQHGRDAVAASQILRATWRKEACGASCSPADKAEVKKLLDEAVVSYGLVIRKRQSLAGGTGVLPWLRPPHKLEVFHILTGTPQTEGEGARTARNRMQRFDEAMCFAAGNCSAGQLKTALREQFAAYTDVEKWREGTIADPKVTSAFDESLNDGWRH